MDEKWVILFVWQECSVHHTPVLALKKCWLTLHMLGSARHSINVRCFCKNFIWNCCCSLCLFACCVNANKSVAKCGNDGVISFLSVVFSCTVFSPSWLCAPEPERQQKVRQTVNHVGNWASQVLPRERCPGACREWRSALWSGAIWCNSVPPASTQCTQPPKARRAPLQTGLPEWHTVERGRGKQGPGLPGSNRLVSGPAKLCPLQMLPEVSTKSKADGLEEGSDFVIGLQ